MMKSDKRARIYSNYFCAAKKATSPVSSFFVSKNGFYFYFAPKPHRRGYFEHGGHCARGPWDAKTFTAS